MYIHNHMSTVEKALHEIDSQSGQQLGRAGQGTGDGGGQREELLRTYSHLQHSPSSQQKLKD